MPEDEAPAQQETPQAPEQAAPEGTPAETQEQVDWEKRYNDLRPEFDRTNQRVSQFEEFYGQLVNPETQAEALRQLGLELEAEDTEDDTEFEDPEEVLKQRLEGVEGFLAEQQAAAEEAEYAELEQAYLEQELGKLGDLSKEKRDAVANLAFAYPDEEGLPDVAKAAEALNQVVEAERQAYLESKKSPKIAADGTAGIEKVDLNDPDQRVKAAAQIIEAESPAD